MIAAAQALEAARATPQPAVPAVDVTVAETVIEPGNETAYGTNVTASGSAGNSGEATRTVAKKKGKVKLTAREKKERSMFIERIVNSLPLEFRGSDPNLRRQIELVIEGFLDREGRGIGSMLSHPPCVALRQLISGDFSVTELIKPPDLNQARVNKCLIALVNRKIVRKDNSTVSSTYDPQGVTTCLLAWKYRALFSIIGMDYRHD